MILLLDKCLQLEPSISLSAFWDGMEVCAATGNGKTTHDSGCILMLISNRHGSKFRVCLVAELPLLELLLSFAMFDGESRMMMPEFQHHLIFGTIGLLLAAYDTSLHATRLCG